MKKVLAMIVMCVAMTMPSQAQVNFGVKGGLNLTNVSLKESEMEDYVKNKVGFFIGPTVKVGLPLTGLSVDIAGLYDERKAEIKGEDGTSTTMKSQTIQVPINLRMGVGLGEALEIFAFLGPQFGFNIGDKEDDFGTNEWRLKTSNLSANFGIGLFVAKHAQVSVNYNLALGSTGEFTIKKGVDEMKSKDKTYAWQVAAAFYF